jgi:hypothetical protein
MRYEKLFNFSLLTVIMPYFGHKELVHILLRQINKQTRNLYN